MTLDLEKGFRALARSLRKEVSAKLSATDQVASDICVKLADACNEAANDLEEQRRKSYGVTTSGDEKTG